MVFFFKFTQKFTVKIHVSRHDMRNRISHSESVDRSKPRVFILEFVSLDDRRDATVKARRTNRRLSRYTLLPIVFDVATRYLA